jgi:hypothetical protein
MAYETIQLAVVEQIEMERLHALTPLVDQISMSSMMRLP